MNHRRHPFLISIFFFFWFFQIISIHMCVWCKLKRLDFDIEQLCQLHEFVFFFRNENSERKERKEQNIKN